MAKNIWTPTPRQEEKRGGGVVTCQAARHCADRLSCSFLPAQNTDVSRGSEAKGSDVFLVSTPRIQFPKVPGQGGEAALGQAAAGLPD